jgi:hypothetical protein
MRPLCAKGDIDLCLTKRIHYSVRVARMDSRTDLRFPPCSGQSKLFMTM